MTILYLQGRSPGVCRNWGSQRVVCARQKYGIYRYAFITRLDFFIQKYYWWTDLKVFFHCAGYLRQYSVSLVLVYYYSDFTL